MAARDLHAERVSDVLRRLRDLPAAPVVAFSGGTDSLALALLAGRAGQPAMLVHVHHGLHPTADDAARHAAVLAEHLGLAFQLEHVDGDAIRRCSRGLEAGARQARYEALAAVACGRPVLTAHTADDRVETLLMRMLQGCGATALGGPLRSVRIAGAVVRRPLLGLWRSDTQRLVESAGMQPWHDPMNTDRRHLRVQIRETLAPHVRDLAAGPALLRTLEQLADDARLLDSVASDGLRGAIREQHADRLVLDRSELRAQPPALRRAVLRRAIREVGARPTREAVATAARRAATAGPASVLGHRLRIEVRRDVVVVARVANPRLPIPAIS